MVLCARIVGVLLILFAIQMILVHCLPKKTNISPYKTISRLKAISGYSKPYKENGVSKYASNIESQADDGVEKASSKYSMTLLNKLLKGAKQKTGENSSNKEISKSLTKPFAAAPKPFCYKEVGTFPAIEYPMHVTDTWGRNYWNQSPGSKFDQEEISYPKYSCNTMKGPEKPNVIKPSDKAIEKAIRALIKARDRSDVSDSMKPTDVCPAVPPNKCFPEDYPGNSTSAPVEVSTNTPTLSPVPTTLTNSEQVTPSTTTPMPPTPANDAATPVDSSVLPAATPVIQDSGSANTLPASSSSSAVPTDTSPTPNLDKVPPVSNFSPTDPEQNPDGMTSGNDLGLNDDDFVTMAPEISYDTVIKNINPDDTSTKFCPGDDDCYILV